MKSPSLVPERICITGNFGTGKTEAWVSWANWLRTTETPGTVWVLNAERDGSVQRANERYEGWQANVQWTNVHNWKELVAATKAYASLAAEGDLVVVDGSDKPWAWVRDLYTETANIRAGVTLDEDDPFATLPEVDMDWDTINGAYFRWFNSLIDDTMAAHLMMVGPSQPLKVVTERVKWGDSKETLDLFSSFGVRWAGQKRMGFDVQTLLLAEVKGSDHLLSTMKDAGGRPYLSKTKVSDFVTEYLVASAGWTL